MDSGANTKIRFIAVGGHALLRGALCTLLAHEEDLVAIGQVPDGEAAVELVDHRRPDVVLLDVERPGTETVRLVMRMRDSSPSTRIIAMTRCVELSFLRALARAGVYRCLSKETTYSVLISALRGEAQERASVAVPLAGLTPREAEIMGFVAQALSNRQISRKLAIAEDTVKRHLHNAFKKLNARSRLEAVQRLYGGLTQSGQSVSRATQHHVGAESGPDMMCR
ncbi:LuxR C-terminal-related transcriptional regulator [Streptomyces sp. LaPpAH-108]|uniref:LuxR C-terminal-related transcriptional regulator n=1 Tax=Streptomyces sp. LaPpAH-108 TaxID=1155714 RepID=UPI0003741865|nr:response regulator transcription factor [Streptomyces sp. LaPpAH-108]